MGVVTDDKPACYGPGVTLQTSLGARLKFLRLELKLGATKVSRLLRKTPAHIFGIEGGRNAPSFKVLESLAQLYNVDPGDLFVFPGSGLKHDIREQLRAIPSVHRHKLEAILQIVERLVLSDTDVRPDVEKILMAMELPAKKKQTRSGQR